MRRIESAHPNLPRLGDARRPVDEPFRFVHDTALTFAPAAITALERRRGPPAADGAAGHRLPRPERRTADSPHRVRARPQAPLRRPDLHPLPRHPAASLRPVLLSGLGAIAADRQPRPGRRIAADPPCRRLDRAGRATERGAAMRWATSRSCSSSAGCRGRYAMPTACAAWLTSHLGVAARVEQFCGHWMRLERPQRSRLMRLGQHGVGRGAVLGESVWDVQHKFRIEIGPLRWDRFSQLLPGASRHQPAPRTGPAVRRLRVRLGPAPGARARRRAALVARRPPRSAGRQAGSHRLDRGAAHDRVAPAMRATWS